VSDRRARAAATLARLGLDPDAVAAGHVVESEVRARLVGADGEALAAALGELPSPPVAVLLVGLEAGTDDKKLRKEIRRALYRLRQQGVPIPEPARDQVVGLARETEAEGFLTAFSGGGDRVLWLERRLPEGGSLVIYAHAHEPRGVLGLSVGEVSQKRLRALRQRMGSELPLRLVRADWRVVDALLVEGSARAAGTDPKRDYGRVRARITSEPPQAPSEPRSARVPPPAPEEAEALVAASAALLEQPEFARWGPESEDTAPFVSEIADVRDSPLVLSPHQQEERVAEVVRRATQSLAPPLPLARRLEGTAYVLAETGRATLARQALAVATTLREHPVQLGTVPFVAAFVRRALHGLVAVETTRAREERRGSLVMTPGEFLRDRESSRRGRTRG
jgi:hypothetical protein